MESAIQLVVFLFLCIYPISWKTCKKIDWGNFGHQDWRHWGNQNRGNQKLIKFFF